MKLILQLYGALYPLSVAICPILPAPWTATMWSTSRGWATRLPPVLPVWILIRRVETHIQALNFGRDGGIRIRDDLSESQVT